MTAQSPGPLPFHHLANLFPMMAAADQDALGADMADKGMLDPIVMLEGGILDGRNRYCQIVKRDLGPPSSTSWRGDPRFIEFAKVSHGMTPLDWVLAKNLNRRHLDESQRSVVAGRIADLKQGRPLRPDTPADDKPANLPVSGTHIEPTDVAPAERRASMTQGAAAEALHVSERSVRDARKVLDHGAEGLVELVEAGAVAVSAAARVADLPVEQQAELISAADPKAFARVAKERRAEGQSKKMARRDAAESGSEATAHQITCPYCHKAFNDPAAALGYAHSATTTAGDTSGGSTLPDTGAAISKADGAAPDPSPQHTKRSRKAKKAKPALPPAREIAACGVRAIVRFGADTIQFYAVDKTPFPTEIGMVEIPRAEAGGHLGADDPLPDDLDGFAGAIFETLLGDEKDRRIPTTIYRLGRTGPVPVRGQEQ